MAATRRAGNMTPGLLKVMERAKQEPKTQFTSLAHLLDAEALTRAFHRLRKNAAVGVDGITVEQYGSNLQAKCKPPTTSVGATDMSRLQSNTLGFVDAPRGNFNYFGVNGNRRSRE